MWEAERPRRTTADANNAFNTWHGGIMDKVLLPQLRTACSNPVGRIFSPAGYTQSVVRAHSLRALTPCMGAARAGANRLTVAADSDNGNFCPKNELRHVATGTAVWLGHAACFLVVSALVRAALLFREQLSQRSGSRAITKEVGSQPPTTFMWKAAQPRFRPIPDHAHGYVCGSGRWLTRHRPRLFPPTRAAAAREAASRAWTLPT